MLRVVSRRYCSASSSSTTSEILVKDIGKNGLMILNRPEAMNAITLPMIRALNSTLRQWENSKNLVVLRGAGDRAFSSGGDLKLLTGKGLEYQKEMFPRVYNFLGFLEDFKIPFVSLLNGVTMGGGLATAVHQKYRVATEKTVSAMPENAVGLFPDTALSYVFARQPRNLGYYLALCGARVKGFDNVRVGFATHFVSSKKLPELQEALLASDGTGVEGILSSFNETSQVPSLLEPHLSEIERCFGASTVEDIVRLLRESDSDFSKSTLETLARMPPTSLKITKMLVDRAASLSLKECLKMDARVISRLMTSFNFKEGVRALLRDKDNSPKWNPSTLENVTDKEVEAYFEMLPEDEELRFNRYLD